MRDKAPETSVGLAAVIARLVEKKPGDRYANPKDLLTDLEDEFDVEIPDYELQDARTFAALADVIERRR